MISEDYKEFINEKILSYLPANRVKSGSDINFRCPVCGDSKKSSTKKRAHYSLKKGIFHCFNCDASMSGIRLLQYLSGQDFDEIKTEYIKLKLKHRDSFDKNIFNCQPKSKLSSLTQIVKSEWKNDLTEDAVNYLNNRKVLQAPFLKEKIYSVTNKDNKEFIMIPWKINGIESYFQLNNFNRQSDNEIKYVFPKNMEKTFYGLDNVDLSWNKVIVFEGVYDSLFVKNGICSGGKTLTEFQYDIIKERYPKQEIVLAFDNDGPGLKASARLIKEFPGRYKFFKWFNENTKSKDINDFVLKTGNINEFADKNKLEKMIISSVEMKMYLISKGLWKNNGPEN